MAISEENTQLAQVLIERADKCFANADALHQEASVLGNAGAFARGLFLHQISLEECAKSEMLAGAVTSLLRGDEVNLKRLYQAMTKHDAKNKANAYFLPVSPEERAARDEGNAQEAIGVFTQLQQDFHRESNLDKNGSLYVNPGEPFSSPLETYTEEDFVKVRERNEQFLSLSYPKVSMLRKWAQDPDAAAKSIEALFDLMKLDELDRGNPQALKEFQASLMQRLEAFSKTQ